MLAMAVVAEHEKATKSKSEYMPSQRRVDGSVDQDRNVSFITVVHYSSMWDRALSYKLL